MDPNGSKIFQNDAKHTHAEQTNVSCTKSFIDWIWLTVIPCSFLCISICCLPSVCMPGPSLPGSLPSKAPKSKTWYLHNSVNSAKKWNRTAIYSPRPFRMHEPESWLSISSSGFDIYDDIWRAPSSHSCQVFNTLVLTLVDVQSSPGSHQWQASMISMAAQSHFRHIQKSLKISNTCKTLWDLFLKQSTLQACKAPICTNMHQCNHEHCWCHMPQPRRATLWWLHQPVWMLRPWPREDSTCQCPSLTKGEQTTQNVLKKYWKPIFSLSNYTVVVSS